ncbi:CAP domain-containing protein [Vararia minispora EC-137]|uniref:CAP domain-containing protein n=1 Tax=Vararia minispora EC-137 TaxID=1314806 RepID=A0ACB8QMF4_9AGAM|nr:CAP domain-containing protein [Vararia minispora EC-137]
MVSFVGALLSGLVALAVTEGALASAIARQTAQQQYLDDHNTVRAQHGAAPLTWSSDLATFAQNWANRCQFAHSGGPNGGEYASAHRCTNIAAGTGGFTIGDAITAWVNEASSYDPNNPQPSHFTQVVWKSSRQLGCAVAACNNILPGFNGISQFYVCEYSPPGNVIGEFP